LSDFNVSTTDKEIVKPAVVIKRNVFTVSESKKKAPFETMNQFSKINEK